MEGVEIQLLSFLTSAHDGGEWSGSYPGRCFPGGRTSLRYPFGRRLGGPNDRYWSFGNAKNASPAGNRTTIPRVSSPYPSHCTDHASTAHYRRQNLQSEQVTGSVPISSQTEARRSCRQVPSRFGLLMSELPVLLRGPWPGGNRKWISIKAVLCG
jgi:hypothetical protein